MSDFQVTPTLASGETKTPFEGGGGVEFPVTIPKLEKVEKALPPPPLVPVKPMSGPDFGFSVLPSEIQATTPKLEPIKVKPPKKSDAFGWPYPRAGGQLQIGDLVVRKDGKYIGGDEGANYPQAICVSIQPFVLVSPCCSMRWEKTVDSDDFVSKGIATNALMLKVLNRLQM